MNMNLNISEIVLDEIALEGLDGITLTTLWVRLTTRDPKISFNLDYQCKCYIWNNILLKNKQLEFFTLPSARPEFIYSDRFLVTDPDTGVCIVENQPTDIYPVQIIKEDRNGLKGSCETFTSRKNITATIRLNEINLTTIEKKFGGIFVIVASQKLRFIALYGKHNYETELYKIICDDKIYCFLERIGRARHQGELTFGCGNINLAFEIKAANTFPLRKKLIKYHLITVQDFSLKQRGTAPNSCGKLLMLSRFHKDHIPLYVTYLTNISNLLSISHEEKLPVLQVKESLNFSKELFRKLLKLGSKYLKVETRQELIANADPKGKNEIEIKLLKLVLPYKGTMNDNEDDDDDGDDVDCSSANGFGMFSEESTFLSHLDQSTLAHCYKIMDAHGNEGLSRKDLEKRMHFSIFDMKLIWKSLEIRECFDITRVEEGKHRFKKLSLKKNTKPSPHPPELIVPAKFKLEQRLNSSTYVVKVKNEEELAQNIYMDLLPIFDENSASLRNVMRASIVLDLVKKFKITSDTQIRQQVFDEEGNKSCTMKSLKKTLQLLVSSKKINKFEKSGVVENVEKKFEFYCDPTVGEDDVELQEALQNRLQKERTNLLSIDTKTMRENTSENVPVLNYVPCTNSKPKFNKAKTMHQLLWYLVYGSKEGPSSDFEMDESYSPDWQKQIYPLPKLRDYPEGWFNVSDVIANMPLSIFLDVVLSIAPENVQGLEANTSDPVKVHTRVHDIKIESISKLSKGRRYLFKFHDICQNLVKLGLLSFGRYDLVKKEETYLFVHTKASLANIPDCLRDSSLFADVGVDRRKSYCFRSFKDIHDYWLAFKTASLDVTSEPLIVKKCKTKESKEKFKDCLKGKEIHEIVDDGRQPGDGLGPGGTDSTLFANLKKNWYKNSDDCIPTESFTFSGYTKRPRIKEEDSVSDQFANRRKPNIVKVKTTLPKKRGSAFGTRQIKRRSSISSNKQKKRKKLEDEKNNDESTETNKTNLKETKKKKCHDEKDEEALRLMTRMRVSWSPEEDVVILLCVLTNLFISNEHKWIVPASVIRDILHEKIEVSKAKTLPAILRRKGYLLKKEVNKKSLKVYYMEAMQNKELCKEFRDDGESHINLNKINEASFRECLAKLEKRICHDNCDNERNLILSNTLEEFNEKFNIDKPYYGLSHSLKEATTTQLVKFYTLQNMVHALPLLNDKISRKVEVYQLLNHIPENEKYPVLKYMIDVGIFVKRKRTDSKSDDNDNSIIGCYQLTQRYQNTFLVTYPNTIFQSTFNLFSSFPPRNNDPCHGSKFISLTDSSSSAALITTLMATNTLYVETVAPAEIVVIQPTSEIQLSPVKMKDKKQIDEDSNDDSDVSDDLDNIDPKGNTCATNSRTLLSWYRCQYAHSKSQKLIDLGNNLFINSCSVKIKLPPKYRTVIKPSAYVSWMNSIHAMDKVRDWNANNSSIHPKTCSVLIKSFRTNFPETIEVDELLQECSHVLDDSLAHLLVALHAHILNSTFVGRTIEELLITFEEPNMETIMYLLKIMSALNLVVRVGVVNFRYVCFEHAKVWLLQGVKNLKGRGVFYNDKHNLNVENFQIEKTLEEADCPLNSCLENSSSDEESLDEDVILSHKNFRIKQKILKKCSEESQQPHQISSNEEKGGSPQKQTTNNLPPKPIQKPPKRRRDSPNPRPAKKTKNQQDKEISIVQEDQQSLSLENNLETLVDGKSNATQIDFLMVQMSKVTHNESIASQQQPQEGTNSNNCGNNKRPGDPISCIPSKRQKSNENQCTDFVGDPNFNSQNKSLTPPHHNSPAFNNIEASHFNFEDTDQPTKSVDVICSDHSKVQQPMGYPMCDNINMNSEYLVPLPIDVLLKDNPMHLNGDEIKVFECNTPLHQFDGTNDMEDSSSKVCQETSISCLRASSRLRNYPNKTTPEPPQGPMAKGTYKMVRNLPRPWKTPEGTINRSALSSMLESICLYLLENPGISRESLEAKYKNVLQPIVLLEFIEIFENLGILNKTLLTKLHKPSLFSKRTRIIPTSEYRGLVTETYSMTPDCILKMGQFLNQLHANKRNSDDTED